MSTMKNGIRKEIYNLNNNPEYWGSEENVENETIIYNYFLENKIVNQDSVVYIKDDVIYLKSRAVLRIFKQLKLPYSLLQLLTILPTFLLDIAYDFIAKRRFRLANKKQCCNG